MTVLYADDRPYAYMPDPDEPNIVRTNCKNCGAPAEYGRVNCAYCGTSLLTKADISDRVPCRSGIRQTTDSIEVYCEPIPLIPNQKFSEFMQKARIFWYADI